ncbi:hypothetical protein BD410DRAFT_867034, partial [Rickenella mellea]
HRDVIPQKPFKWPTEAEVDALTERAGGLFIFASTVVGFLDESSYRAPERLSSILNAKPTASSSNLNPYANLDKLYHQILEYMLHAGPDSSEDTAFMFRRVVGTILLLRKPATCKDLIIKVPMEDQPMEAEDGPSEVENASNEEDDEPSKIEIFHKSFHDYLTDTARCTDIRLFIDPHIQHSIIAATCLNAMINLLESFPSQNIYRGEAPEECYNIPEWLCYAGSEWTEHGVVCLQDAQLLHLAKLFFSTTSLNWIRLLAMSEMDLHCFMRCIEQAAQLGLVWSPFLSISLQHLGASLSIPLGANRDDFKWGLAIQSFTFASVLAVGLPPADSGCYFACGFIDVLSPFSMISFSEINDWDFWDGFPLVWLENASVRARPGSPAQTAYYHILGCITFQQHNFEQSVEWFQRALPVDVLDHGHSFEVLRDMVAVRCYGAQEYRDFLDDKWCLPLQVVDSYIRSLERARECRADALFTLGNLYWMRFQLVDNASHSKDIDISIQHLQNAANAAPPNSLRLASLENLGRSLCMRYEFYGSHADIDAAEQSLREYKAQNCCDLIARFLPRDLGYAMYKSFKLRGQCEDIAKSIMYLTEFYGSGWDRDGVERDLDEAYDALRKLERNNPGAAVEIWKRCHNPKNWEDVWTLNRMIDRHSSCFDEASDASVIGSEDDVPMQEVSILTSISTDEYEVLQALLLMSGTTARA